MKKILVDTDILIDYLRGQNDALEFIKSNARSIVLSAITVAELYAGIKSEHEKTVLGQFISLFPVMPVSQEIAMTGGLMRNQFRRSHGVGLADAIIAATCQIHGLSLRTLNLKHFPMFPALRAPYTK